MNLRFYQSNLNFKNRLGKYRETRQNCSRLEGRHFKVEERMPLDFRLDTALTGYRQGGSRIENKYLGLSR